jgi:hypothetical protein
MTQIVLDSIVSMVSKGNLYFLLSESDSSGGSVIYLIKSRGISGELVIYSSSLGW